MRQVVIVVSLEVIPFVALETCKVQLPKKSADNFSFSTHAMEAALRPRRARCVVVDSASHICGRGGARCEASEDKGEIKAKD